MDERVIQFRVGVVVVAAAIITVILIILFGEGFRRQYSVYLQFAEAPGVTVDTPVRKSGVLIGRVSDVELLDEGGVRLTISIDSGRTLRHDEICRISTTSLLGDAVLEFVPSSDADLLKKFDGNKNGQLDADEREKAKLVVQHGDFLADGVVATDPMKMLVGLEDRVTGALDSIQGAGNEVGLVARNLNAVVENNDEQLQRVIQKSEIALDSFNQAMANVNEIVGDPEMKARLRQMLEDLPKLVDEAQQTMASARQTLENFDRVSRSAEANLANLEDLTRPLGERGEQLAADMARSIRNLDELLGQAVLLSQAINDRQGSLGKLVYEREMYEKLDRAASNIEDLSRRLKPIVEDVRIFTDKISTDPRQLGVKGALDRRPSGSGLKYGVPSDSP